ncbi:hypothetical protein JR316_0000653 [Psilocybe cubensis]|uniref:Homeobox domain-containing protein n=2 Tax=Psilocybe cubensis TaxID=181762 RepID=A0A8H7Y7S6_PSICU|nr:hypothetical protein JR316_0000653 [Psilocybe cubensis]KAH9486588.1 hypothetical protein JR316_0000653 [Psilocybe cubensis]
MTTAAVPQAPGPLHFLASVITDISDDTSPRDQSSSPESSSRPSSPISTLSSSSTAPSNHGSSLHPPSKLTRLPEAEHRILQHSTSSNHLPSSDPSFVPFIRHKSARKVPKAADPNLKGKLQMKKRRKELLDKAMKIKSLDNSPVNERQLLVLRMVYDEITMYPCESWMVLIAIIIHRAYKQVKNWFSNERQKNRTGESVPLETEDGDKVRLRSSALLMCQEWSDSFFEEVVMIYNYRVQRNSRFRGSLRRPDIMSNHD